MTDIIIVTHNSEKFIEHCLNSIPKNYRIIIIDNASKDKTKEIVKKFENVKLIENKKNIGFTKAVNQGIKETRSEFILLLNPDIIVLGDAIKKLEEFMKVHPECGAVAPQLLNPDLTIQNSCRKFPTPFNIFLEFMLLPRIFKKLSLWKMGYFKHNKLCEVEQPMASAIMIRKKVFKKIGYFNEKYKNYVSDVDFCYRMKKEGFKIYFYPDAKMIHYLGRTMKMYPLKSVIELHHSLYKFLKENYDKKFLLIIDGFLLYFSMLIRVFFLLFFKFFKNIFRCFFTR